MTTIMELQTKLSTKTDKKLALLLFTLFFTIFLFSSDGHRATSDEDWAHMQTLKFVTLQPHPLFEPGVSKQFYEHPTMYPPEASWMQNAKLCNHPLLCTASSIGLSITQYPFVFINYHLQLLTPESVIWTLDDFQDGHYVSWRNSIDPNFTFLEIFFGPFYMALSVSIFYLICRTYNYKNKTSLILTFILGLSTTFWAFSQTSLSSVPAIFFIILGFYFFRKFEVQHSAFYLLLSASSLGFGFVIRNDLILFLAPLFCIFLIKLFQEKQKIIKLFSFISPLLVFYFIWKYFSSLSYISSQNNELYTLTRPLLIQYSQSIFHEGILGILFSPGVGLFIFSPILLTVFFSFPDFFKKNKTHVIFFISISFIYVFYFGTLDHWHGLVTWGARYLLPLIPFMLIPLGMSIEKRNNKPLYLIILFLSASGFLFNFVYLIQDVTWFVWGKAGHPEGLYGLGTAQIDLYLHPATIWTFEYSQLTHSIILSIQNLQFDIFMNKFLGFPLYAVFFILIITLHFFLIRKTINSKNISNRK